jgi:hypothetical protein
VQDLAEQLLSQATVYLAQKLANSGARSSLEDPAKQWLPKSATQLFLLKENPGNWSPQWVDSVLIAGDGSGL